MIERNAGLASDKRIEFRIGIHLGGVVEESDGHLVGDGVNIVARLAAFGIDPNIIASHAKVVVMVRSPRVGYS